MRIDKYLKISRLIKRRSIAKDACDAGKIAINGKKAKAGSEVKVGDKVTMTFGEKSIEVEILIIKEHVKKEETKDLYRQIG
ncbi:RNA-binding S4 domain-containing protein [Helicovermis profundi]|uniref:RQC P-site tRNA stabilizing factor n=1 Tax=Helicovermis profundi TaxID=3065157 RepID=A0AAU9E065_9FIRM|nr:RNA-binding S4 domain-containing protein [Clostridia bacterium S502]